MKKLLTLALFSLSISAAYKTGHTCTKALCQATKSCVVGKPYCATKPCSAHAFCAKVCPRNCFYQPAKFVKEGSDRDAAYSRKNKQTK